MFFFTVFFTNNEYNNLKYLHLYFNQNITSKQQLRIPELEECILLNKEDLSEMDFDVNCNSIIDFSSSKKMKILKVPVDDFVLIKNFNSIENVTLNSSKDISKETEIKMLEKILSIKNLDFISFNLYKININEILKIKGQNSYVTKINIYYNYENEDISLFDLDYKFPNLSDIFLSIHDNHLTGVPINLEIKENSNCKINKLTLVGYGKKNVKMCIQSYETLIKFEINRIYEIINLKDSFPIFNDKPSVIFKSLIEFIFINYNRKGITYNILNNIYNNIDNMPNLKKFTLVCYSKEIDEFFYNKLIKKILRLNLDSIWLQITNNKNIKDNEIKTKGYYKLDELKELFPDLNLNNKNIQIKKL